MVEEMGIIPWKITDKEDGLMSDTSVLINTLFSYIHVSIVVWYAKARPLMLNICLVLYSY